MSPVKVSVMLSMVAAAAAAGGLLPIGGECERWVESPANCAAQEGCMVAPDGIDCIPKLVEMSNSGIVWLQHPEIAGPPGLPTFQAPDEKVPGWHVENSRGGPDFNVGGNNFLEKIPEFLGDTYFHAVPSVSKAGGLKFECPEMETGSCDFFVAVFSCAPCSDRINGGLPKILTVTHGWEARSCAPVMRIPHDDDEYKMTTFRVRVQNGHFVESPRFLRNAQFIAVFSSTKETGFCPVPVRTVGPFPSGGKCGTNKCPFLDPEA